MSEQITIWHVGNTGLRNPNRIQEGFSVFADSPFVGNLREENEVAFMKYLNEMGIIQNKEGKDIVIEKYCDLPIWQVAEHYFIPFILQRTSDHSGYKYRGEAVDYYSSSDH